MADEAVNPTVLTLNGSVLDPTGVTVEAANFAVLTKNDATADPDASEHTAKDQVKLSKVVLRLSSATGATPAATILAGDQFPSNAEVLGNLAVDLGAGETKWVVIEAARFTQDDGSVRIDSGVADLVVAALELPHGL